MARLAPAAPCRSFAISSISAYAPASPRPRPPDTTTVASSSLVRCALRRGTRRSGRCPSHRRRRRAPRRPWPARPPQVRRRRTSRERRRCPGPARELRPHGQRSAKDRVLGDEPVVISESGHVGEHRSVKSRRESSRDVAAVVARGNEDRVGRARARDERGDRRGDGHAGSAPPRSPTS